MIIVINLLRNIFIIMFFILMILEIVVLISLTTLYRIPLYSNINNVTEASTENTLQIVNSFNFLFVRKYYNLATDLLLISKHIYPMYLTLDKTSKNPSSYPTFNNPSAFVNSYKNSKCLISSQIFYDQVNKNNINLYNPPQIYNLYKRLLEANYNFTTYAESDIIDIVFNNTYSSNMVYYPENALQNILYDPNTDPYIYFCYSVSMLKTIMTRNMIFEKNNGFVDRFLLFIRNESIFQYPVEIINKEVLKYYPYFSDPNGRCTAADCFTTINTFESNFNSKTDIFFDVPTFINGYGYANRGCIRIQFTGSSNDYACIDFNLNNLLKQNKVTEISDTVKLFLVYQNKTNSDLTLFYMNQMSDLTNFNQTIFNSSYLQNYKLSDNNISPYYISLFHGIYYSLYAGYPDILSDQGRIKQTMSEYSEIVKTLNNAINNNFKFNNDSACNLNYTNSKGNISINKPITFDFNLTFLDQQIELKSFQKKNYPDLDDFKLTIYPVLLNYSTYDPNTYLFENNCKPTILFYSVVLTQVGTKTLPSKIYLILILKCIRSCFFFISLLVFAMIVYFILCEIYVKFLIVPIKYIKQNLEILIKERNNPESFEDDKQTGIVESHQQNSKENIENNKQEIDSDRKKYKFTNIFTNLETKKLEDMIENLKKIILMKNAQGKYDFKEKSKIYKKFLKDTRNDKEHFRQCLLIIAYSKYRNSEYDKAYKNLEKLLKNTEAEEEEILSKNESYEQKLINLPNTISNQIQYLNDFTDNEINGDEELNKLAKLRILNQKIYYFYGFLKFSDYKKKRSKIKAELANKFDNKEKLKDEVRNQMKIHSKLLVDATKYLKKSLTINNAMHFNLIKCIFILILLSNCAYLSEEYPEASNHLREALLRFSDLNKFFFDRKIDDQVDPRVMFIINGVIMEQILYNIGKICNKVQKKKLAAWVFNKLMEITYFRSENIHRKACNKLYEILFMTKFTSQHKKQENTYYMSECLLRKIKNRFDNHNKSLLIMISDNLLENFCSRYELKEVLLKCIDKYLNKTDKLNFVQFNYELQSLVYFDTVEKNFPLLKNDVKLCSRPDNYIPGMKINFAKILKKGIETFKKDNNLIEEGNSNDRYIFLFIYSSDFRFDSKEENHEIIHLLVSNQISLYVFILDEIPEKKIFKIKDYLNYLMEGYLILVKNFQIIEESFQNITPVGLRKKKQGDSESTDNCFSHNILDSNFENHKYIL